MKSSCAFEGLLEARTGAGPSRGLAGLTFGEAAAFGGATFFDGVGTLDSLKVAI